MSSFLGGKSCGAFGQPAFFLTGNRMNIVAVLKRRFLLKFFLVYLAKRLFDSTEVVKLRKIPNIFKWTEKV